MASVRQLLRAAALAAAVLLLPCCRDEIGRGDRLSHVTVRASLTLAAVEPNLACSEPDVSENGRFVVWASTSNTLTPNDNNGIRDVFLKDRTTGVIENLTDVVVVGAFPQFAPRDCFEPVVSDDGRYVAFSSVGGWVTYTLPASANPHRYIYRYDRQLDVFERAYADGGVQPNGPMSNPSISADGRYIAYAASASNLVPPNGSGQQQIYVHDMQTGLSRIVSRQQSPAALNTPVNGACLNPRISPDGGFISFESYATNIAAATAAVSKPQVYVGTNAGDYAVVVARDSSGTLTADASYYADVSAGGRYVVFHSYDANLVAPPAASTPILLRRDLVAGTTELVTDEPGQLFFAVFPNGFAPTISSDGRSIAFLGRDNSLSGGVPLNFVANVFVRDMLGGITLVSRHLDGTPSNLDCDPPRLSGDGQWVLWSTAGSTLVDGDTNGVSDIFLRGPLR